MADPNHHDRIQQLTDLATDTRDDPQQHKRRRLADAALIHGLIHSDRLDATVLHTLARIEEVSTEALRELQHAADTELRRRDRR
jgi:hypothetical protein